MTVNIGPIPREREKDKEMIGERKIIQTILPAPTESTADPCRTVNQI